jgi:hypothetical protein
LGMAKVLSLEETTAQWCQIREGEPTAETAQLCQKEESTARECQAAWNMNTMSLSRQRTRVDAASSSPTSILFCGLIAGIAMPAKGLTCSSGEILSTHVECNFDADFCAFSNTASGLCRSTPLIPPPPSAPKRSNSPRPTPSTITYAPLVSLSHIRDTHTCPHHHSKL